MTREELLKRFDDYRGQLRDGLLKSHEQYDKALTLISSGGLALSLAFIEKIGGENPICSISLVAAWVLLALTLIFSLVSSLFSILKFQQVEKSWENVMDHFYELYSVDGMPERLFEKKAEAARGLHKQHTQLVSTLNTRSSYAIWAPMITLLFGVVFLLHFSSANLLIQKPNVQSTTAPHPAEPAQPRSRDQRHTTTTTAATTQSTQQPKEVKEEATK